jgi:hypothetical protein
LLISSKRRLLFAGLSASVLALACKTNCESHILFLKYSIPNASDGPCILSLSGPRASIAYDFPALPAGGCGICPGTSPCPCVSCTTMSGPAPLDCTRYTDQSGDVIWVFFDQPDSSPLSNETGATTMLVTIECGGATVVHDDPQTEICNVGQVRKSK